MQIEYCPGFHRNFADNYFAFRLVVALNVYRFKVKHLALDNVYYQVDVVCIYIRAAQYPYYRIYIAELSVIFAYLLYQFVNLRW